MRNLLLLVPMLLGLATPIDAQENRDDVLAMKTRTGTLTMDEVIEIEERLGRDDWRAAKLKLSPRRHEDVVLTLAGRKIGALVVYPDRSTPAPVIVMVPEDQGLNRWARDMADQIAAMGYVVVAPDFLFGKGPNGGGGSSFADVRSVFVTHRTMPKNEAQQTADLNAWADYGLKLPGTNGKLGAVGFGWGGGRVWAFAAQRKDLSAAFVFYDALPAGVSVSGLTAPVYGFYAEYDPRVARSLAGTAAQMTAAGKRYESVTYPGAEHMFVRLGDEPRNRDPANILARHRSLARLQELLATM